MPKCRKADSNPNEGDEDADSNAGPEAFTPREVVKARELARRSR
jgi:hypothetical protein